MISRQILEAQKGLYQKGRQQAMMELERAKANVSSFNGAIKACDDLLRVLGQMEEAQENQKPESEAEKES